MASIRMTVQQYSRALPRIACDSLVARGATTRNGDTVFAKNSDRPALECQPLIQVQPATYTANQTVRCTHIEIPQADSSFGIIGSKPYWCWGFEHGLNDQGVVIGNHSVFTKETPSEPGLIGMDIVRLALERARNTDLAIEVITGLVESYGQGGSGYADTDWSYNNSFLVADRDKAVLIETSNRDWAPTGNRSMGRGFESSQHP